MRKRLGELVIREPAVKEAVRYVWLKQRDTSASILQYDYHPPTRAESIQSRVYSLTEREASVWRAFITISEACCANDERYLTYYGHDVLGASSARR